MNHPTKSHDMLVYRLSQVLQKLNQGESLDPHKLADEFGVNLRTIQRDLNVLYRRAFGQGALGSPPPN